MNRVTPHAANDPFPRGEGYLYFAGLLQIGAGILSLGFSLLASGRAQAIGAGGLLDPGRVAGLYGGSEGGSFASFTAGFVSFQAAYGWIFGALLVVAGFCSIYCWARWLVGLSALVNLINFPHGTTVALFVLHGLTRPGVTRAFLREGDRLRRSTPPRTDERETERRIEESIAASEKPTRPSSAMPDRRKNQVTFP